MERPNSTKALVFTAPQSPLTVQPIPLPELSASELLIEVHAASINPVDLQIWDLPIWRLWAGQKGLGRDFSGRVVEVGQSNRGWSVGDECFGLYLRPNGKGTIAERLIVDLNVDTVVKKPADLPHTTAAAMPLVALTAISCLSWLPLAQHGGVKRRIVVQGASGGTGTWIVQLATKMYNCHVTAICSGKNVDFVKELGADDVIDYTKNNVVEKLRSKCPEDKFDAIIDCVGGTDILPYVPELIQPEGAYVTIVGDKTSRTSMGGHITYLLNPAQTLRYIKGYFWGPRYATISLIWSTEDLRACVGYWQKGLVKVEIQEIIEGILEKEAAWKRMVALTEAGRVRGKVVLKIL